jgi:hypothetical protein
MSITVCTNRYITAHGKSPRGRGMWAFEIPAGSDATGGKWDRQVWFTPAPCTFAQAVAGVKAHVRAMEIRNIVIHAAP